MTTTETPERRVVEIQIESASAVEGRDGPQWELKLRYPWSMKSKWPDTTWIDREGTTPPTGRHMVQVERKEIKKSKEGVGPKDPAQDFNWNWRIVGWDEEAPAGPSEATGATPEGQPYTKADTVPSEAPAQAAQSAAPSYEDRWAREQEGMSRAVALKAAVEFYTPRTIDAFDEEQKIVIEAAQVYYNWLSGNDAPTTPDDAQETAPVAEAKPADTEATSESPAPTSFKERGWTKREVARFLEIEVPEKPVEGWNPLKLWLIQHQGKTVADAMAECELQAAQQEIDNAPKK